MRVAEKTLEIINPNGLHARVSTRLAQAALEFRSTIRISRESGGEEVDAKSVIGILSLGAEKGERVRVRCQGSDADAAMRAITAVFSSRFDDE